MAVQPSLTDVTADVAGLSPAEREVFRMVERGPYGPREYARQTDRSPGTVGNLLRRARRKLEEVESDAAM